MLIVLVRIPFILWVLSAFGRRRLSGCASRFFDFGFKLAVQQNFYIFYINLSKLNNSLRNYIEI